ncbi:MAG: 3'(2'),5'-bisphosphate nucleotidase CysQ [Terriglobia bacterium]
MNDSNAIVERIEKALDLAIAALKPFVPGAVEAKFKSGDDPVTEADHAVNRVLQEILLRGGEGWFSEESADDLSRLKKERVWIVDPLDGTREFVAGIPEWCISVAFVEDGAAVAGGIANPATQEIFLGSCGEGLLYNGNRVYPSSRNRLQGAKVLASRSEVNRGEWERFRNAPFAVQPMGSVAYKLARVAAGLDDATWTLTPKHEWDVAAGVALVEAAGGFAGALDFSRPAFNRESPLLSGLVASGPLLRDEMIAFLRPHIQELGLLEQQNTKHSSLPA